MVKLTTWSQFITIQTAREKCTVVNRQGEPFPNFLRHNYMAINISLSTTVFPEEHTASHIITTTTEAIFTTYSIKYSSTSNSSSQSHTLYTTATIAGATTLFLLFIAVD